MKDACEILGEKGITSPQPPTKGGVYTLVQESGDRFLHCSGCGPDLGNGNTVVGEPGKDLTVEEGQRATYNYMLNLLANLSDKVEDLNRVKWFVKILAFASSADDSGMQPQVANEGSNLTTELPGEGAGPPARSAIGTDALPGGIACEIGALVELKQGRGQQRRS